MFENEIKDLREMNCIRNYFLLSPLKGFDELEYVMLL